jgi:uncharacterized protein with HEPN domain
MREPSRDKGRLLHIVKYATNVEEMTEGFTFEQFAKDKIRYFAVMKNVEVVGEAAYMLTKEFIASHPELPWKQIIGMRHILVHGYATVSVKTLWNTAINDIPPLKRQVEKYLESMEG